MNVLDFGQINAQHFQNLVFMSHGDCIDNFEQLWVSQAPRLVALIRFQVPNQSGIHLTVYTLHRDRCCHHSLCHQQSFSLHQQRSFSLQICKQPPQFVVILKLNNSLYSLEHSVQFTNLNTSVVGFDTIYLASNNFIHVCSLTKLTNYLV